MDGSNSVMTERINLMHAAPSLSAASPPATPRRHRISGKRLLLAAAGLSVLTGAGSYGWRWWTDGRFTVDTDDAFVQADMVGVSSRVAGQVAEVLVGDNQPVRRGDVLIRLDDRDLQSALAQARAEVASAEADINAIGAQLRLQSSTVAAADADVQSANAAATFARAEQARYADLLRTGNGSLQRSQQAEADILGRMAFLARTRAAAEGARQQVAVLNAQLGRAQAAMLRVQAVARQAELNLGYATVVAPADGAVGDRTVRPGQYVQPGGRLLSVVPMGEQLYLVANFKETQLARMGRGETATIDVDMLGGSFKGVVDSLAPGSGSTFALLPPENATGNFTKIVQRVPVRIRLLPDTRLAQLRPGLSASVTVDPRTAPPGPLLTQAGSETRS